MQVVRRSCKVKVVAIETERVDGRRKLVVGHTICRLAVGVLQADFFIKKTKKSRRKRM